MTEAPLVFKSSVRRKDPITFQLDDEDHGFIPPKSAVMMLPAYVGVGEGQTGYLRAQFDWFEAGLNAYDWSKMDQTARRAAHGEDVSAEPADAVVPPNPAWDFPPEGWQGPQAERIEKRLRDPRDLLDTDDLDEIITDLAKRVAGRPTT